MSVKRWGPILEYSIDEWAEDGSYNYADMEEDKHGEYVKYEDYEKVLSKTDKFWLELRALKEENTALKANQSNPELVTSPLSQI